MESLTQLDSLCLNHEAITDAGLVHLKELRALKRLELTNTGVTDAGVAELQKALPHCQIIR